MSISKQEKLYSKFAFILEIQFESEDGIVKKHYLFSGDGFTYINNHGNEITLLYEKKDWKMTVKIEGKKQRVGRILKIHFEKGIISETTK